MNNIRAFDVYLTWNNQNRVNGNICGLLISLTFRTSGAQWLGTLLSEKLLEPFSHHLLRGTQSQIACRFPLKHHPYVSFCWKSVFCFTTEQLRSWFCTLQNLINSRPEHWSYKSWNHGTVCGCYLRGIAKIFLDVATMEVCNLFLSKSTKDVGRFRIQWGDSEEIVARNADFGSLPQ